MSSFCSFCWWLHFIQLTINKCTKKENYRLMFTALPSQLIPTIFTWTYTHLLSVIYSSLKKVDNYFVTQFCYSFSIYCLSKVRKCRYILHIYMSTVLVNCDEKLCVYNVWRCYNDFLSSQYAQVTYFKRFRNGEQIFISIKPLKCTFVRVHTSFCRAQGMRALQIKHLLN